MSKYNKGELVVFKTHPFIGDFTNIKITAYSDYTSPILVIKEFKEKIFDKETGRDSGQQLNCSYYNSKEGKFVDKWINSNLIEKISYSPLKDNILSDLDFKKDLENLNKDLSSKNYENLIKDSYLNNKVVLKSVDIELSKIKSNRAKDNGDLIETNHLEFLPPIMAIIGFKFSDEKNKFCESTGLALIELKCKWYNSNSKTFSESYFPSTILYKIAETQNLINDKDLLNDVVVSIEENSLIILPIQKSFILEDDSTGKKIINTIGQSDSILFKHYFYQMNYFDFLTQKKAIIPIKKAFETKNETDIFSKKYPSYNKGYRLKVTDCKFETNNYYSIIYKDKFDIITKRIIKVIDLIIYIKNFEEFKNTYESLESWNPEQNINFVNYKYKENGKIYIQLDGESIPNNTLPKTIFEDKNVDIILNTNCLLRRGKIRNFKLNGILQVHEIINGHDIFEG